MPRAILVLLLGLALLGCSKRASPVTSPRPEEPAVAGEVPLPDAAEATGLPDTDPEPPAPVPPVDPLPDAEVPQAGGRIRALVPAGESPDTFLGSLATPKRLFAGPADWQVEGRCYRVPVVGWTDTAVAADGLVEAWNAELESGLGPLHWVLAIESAPALVASGSRRLAAGDVRARDGAIQICGAGSVTDVAVRLAHPILREAATLRSSASTFAPFRRRSDGRLVRNPNYPGAGPYADLVDSISSEGDRALLFKLGDVDVAIVHGRHVRALAAAPEQVALERVPALDPAYFLWLNPDKRWLNAPRFREWLAGAIDRAEIVRVLFDGLGRRAYTLRADGEPVPSYDIRTAAPFAPTSRPQLDLRFEGSDPTAEILAARLRASLGIERVELRLRPLSRRELLENLAAGDVEVALLAHRPETADPVLGLLGALWWLGEPVRAETLALLDCARLTDPAERAVEATRVEQALLADARIIPLVRLEAWLATNRRLAGVEVEPYGTIRLGAAWWRR